MLLGDRLLLHQLGLHCLHMSHKKDARLVHGFIYFFMLTELFVFSLHAG